MYVDAAKFLTFLLLHQSCSSAWLKVWNQLQNISQSIFWGTRYIKLIHSNTVIYVLLPTYFFWEEAFPFFLSYLTGNYMYLLPSYICTFFRFIIKFFVCWTLVEHVIIFSEPLKIIFIFQCNILTGVESGAVLTYSL